MRTVWINRNARSWPSEARAADHQIGDLSALLRLLDELE